MVHSYGKIVAKFLSMEYWNTFFASKQAVVIL